MRPTGIAGIVLTLLGAIVLVFGGSFTTRRDMVRMGDFKITADETRTIPVWAGVLCIVGGLALVVTGARRRSA